MAIGAEAALRFAECPAYAPMATLDEEKYAGVWYDIYHD